MNDRELMLDLVCDFVEHGWRDPHDIATEIAEPGSPRFVLALATARRVLFEMYAHEEGENDGLQAD